MLSFSTRNTAVLSVPLSNARGPAQVKCLRAHRSHSVVATVTVILGSWRRLRGFACRASRVDDVTAESRNLALQAELSKLGISFEALDRPPHDPLLSPALRCCKAFVSPATPLALQVSGQPGRAARVAADVAHLVRAARDALAAWKKETQMEVPSNTDGRLTLVMDCVRSTRNVGSLLRTCAVAGADVVFCGITPAPPMPAVLQAASGASTVPSSFAVSSKSAVKELQQQGYQVWALETTSRAKPLESLVLPAGPLALVVGHESYGVSVAALDCCDEHVCLSTFGMKNSLNVAVAGSIAIFNVVERRCE